MAEFWIDEILRISRRGFEARVRRKDEIGTTQRIVRLAGRDLRCMASVVATDPLAHYGIGAVLHADRSFLRVSIRSTNGTEADVEFVATAGELYALGDTFGYFTERIGDGYRVEDWRAPEGSK